MKRLTVTMFGLLFASTFSSCSSTSDSSGTSSASPSGSGARLSVDYFGDTDVVGFHIELERVKCYEDEEFEPFSAAANVDLVDGIFPAMIQFLEFNPLDPDSKHLGADMFLTLDPGCYDVLAVPAKYIDGEEWGASEDCGSASAEAVEVFEETTTEITLVSQCVGDPNGALDTLVLLNHPPNIEIEIDEKFNYECEPVEVCAVGYDVDDDPLEFVWDVTPDPWSVKKGDLEVIGFDEGHRIWRQCATIVTQDVTSYEVEVTAYDLGWEDGMLKRMEEILGEESRASITGPIHTNWVEEPLCFDDGELVPAEGVDIERAKGCGYTTAEEFYCGDKWDVPPALSEFLCDGDDLIEEALYPDCD